MAARPLDKADLAKRFAARFRGLERAHGIYHVSDSPGRKGKTSGRAKTVREMVTVDKWRDHLGGKAGLGIVPIDDDSLCRFGAIDVDVYDLNLEALEKRVKSLGLPLVVCRTKSGGAHLYLFMREATSAETLRGNLMEWAVVLGYPNSEVFPKQSKMVEDDFGSWINMPYFQGDATTRYALRDGLALTASEFLDLADLAAVPKGGLENIKVPSDDRLAEAPPCLQHLAWAGFPEGTRNKALFNLGIYAKLRYEDGWKAKVDEFNQSFMTPPLSSEEVKLVVGSLAKKKYCYTCKDSPIAAVCNRAICVKRKFGVGGGGDDPGVALDGLTKIKTDPPMWVLAVDGRRMRLNTTDDLVDQGRFCVLCIEALNILPQRVSRPAWDDIVRGLLEKVEEVDAPGDAGLAGQFVYMVQQFCAESAPARNRDELLLGKPWEEDGFTYFRSNDLLSYAEKRKVRLYPRESWSVLRDIGAKTKEFKVKGRCVRCWGVPTPAKQEGAFDVPSIKNEEEY
jgi:hypothetical protein